MPKTKASERKSKGRIPKIRSRARWGDERTGLVCGRWTTDKGEVGPANLELTESIPDSCIRDKYDTYTQKSYQIHQVMTISIVKRVKRDNTAALISVRRFRNY